MRQKPLNTSAPPRPRAWLDLARAGNFPSVASNVLAALVLSSGAPAVFPRPGELGVAILAGILLYAGGATLNDVADASFDARHRPERAIPRGLISRRAAAWVGALEMASGLALLVGSGASLVWGAALVAVILAYDWVHKRWSGSVILMAGCRVLLALTVASLPQHSVTPALLGWLGVLFAYIVTLSVLARSEYALARQTVAAAHAKDQSERAARLGRGVGRMLAFIPLIDAVAVAVAGGWLAAVCCALAVPVGRWAQRVAAST